MASTVWRGFVTFGLISIPVRLFRAARPERISLRRVQRVPRGPERAAASDDGDDDAESDAAEEILSDAGSRPAAFNSFDLAPPAGSKGKAGAAAASLPPAVHEPPPELRPVKQAAVSASTGQAIVPERNIVKAYEYEKERFVELTPEELKSLVRKTASEMEIQEFVSLAEIDPVYFETSYYVVPEEAGAKAYALLYQSLANSGLVAVSQLAMHGREHVVILRSGRTGMLAHTMFYAPEVHADEEYRADTSSLSEKELNLAQALISSLTAQFEPTKYRDTYQNQLEELIARKVAGQPTVAAAAPPKASVIDITEALQRSLAALKKPPASDSVEERPSSSPRKKRTRSAS